MSSSSPPPPPPSSTAPSEDVKPKQEEKKAPAKAAAPSVVPRTEQKETEGLTNMLKKITLGREEKSAGDRLKVIQDDPTQAHLTSAKTFQELNLPKHLLDAIFAMGFNRPSAIQEEALPRILADPPRNLIGQAQSGSGKTAAFTVGMLFRINVDKPATTQALCVTPTRELAIQIVDKAIKPMAANMNGLKIELAIPGTNLRSAVDAHLIVGTPGKVSEWLKRRYITAKTIKVFVLDEADNMVEEGGHRASSLLIKKQMSKSCQSLLFSATFPPEVISFASKIIEKPDKILIDSGPKSLVLDVIKQLWVDTRNYQGGKLEFLADIYSLLTIGQSMIFVETRRSADLVHDTLTRGGYTCSVLHGGLEPSQRDETMLAFRENKANVLITTNVLARGVDVDNVCLVINFDPPTDRDRNPDFETYLHRIGRTGRFGRKGTAINLVDDQNSLHIIAAIERHFQQGDKEMIHQAEADPEALAANIEI